MAGGRHLGIDCGSISLNLVLFEDGTRDPVLVYARTRGRPLKTLADTLSDLIAARGDLTVDGCLVTGSGRDLIADALRIPSVNEITAHAAGIGHVDPRVRTIIEVGGQDSKFIRIRASHDGGRPAIPVFRMNEICAAGTGAFLDEQAARLGIPVESFGSIAMASSTPAPIAGRCAVFAKTDMIHRAQEGAALPDILMGLAFALARNYLASLVRGEPLTPVVSLQGGVMCNQAVVHAFKVLLELNDHEVITPPHFTVMGALGCAVLAADAARRERLTLEMLRSRSSAALSAERSKSSLPPLERSREEAAGPPPCRCPETPIRRPVAMGLDVGSVSVKGVLVDREGCVVADEYLISHSRPLEALGEVTTALLTKGPPPDLVAVTGSGRHLAGRLMDADLIVNEISAQARAALRFAPDLDTVVEIGGQDSKWIAFERGHVRDFEMNRVCAAGTGSFLMEQAERLGIALDEEFSAAAFASRAPVDLGSRCTVFMESDLIHHQNNGAQTEDLAAGVCVSIVHNYLDRVANNKPLGAKVVFLGGVAAAPAVRAAFERETGRSFVVPPFYKVSGALGAALAMLEDQPSRASTDTGPRTSLSLSSIRKEQFRCRGCPNKCLVDIYRDGDRKIFHGGLCDRWEIQGGGDPDPGEDLFALRSALLGATASGDRVSPEVWGIVRGPQFYEWFPFWKAFVGELGIPLGLPAAYNRPQFERGLRHIKVETCLPIKAMAGQAAELVESGVRTIFHPTILSEPLPSDSDRVLLHCPYIQASDQLLRGSFDVEWKVLRVRSEVHPDAFRAEHLRFARGLGCTSREASSALEAGFEQIHDFRRALREAGARFLDSLDGSEPALVVLGKPYHTSEPFLNMNLSSLFQRLRVRAVPGDLLPITEEGPQSEVSWRYQGAMIRTARAIAGNARLFPVMITFFGCGPDPFTIRHVRSALRGKPLLVLEMDEHASRAGVMTRVEAFLDHIRRQRAVPAPRRGQTGEHLPSKPQAEILFLPSMGDHAYGFAAAARSVGIDARVLPEPDEESANLGRPHLVGGECHPYAILLGDYLKLARSLPREAAERSLFFMLGPDACRLGQYPVAMEHVRRELGCATRVVSDVDDALRSFGVSPQDRSSVMLRGWEGLIAFDLLTRLHVIVRSSAADQAETDRAYARSRDILFAALVDGRVRQGMEEALEGLYAIPVEKSPRPVVAVTGDYYTRVVSFANNDVYHEIERLGGLMWTPPTFSDSYKLGTLQEVVWGLMGRRARDAIRFGALYAFMVLSEYKVKGGRTARRVPGGRCDFLGARQWSAAARRADVRLPAGITAPLTTALEQVELGADGVLNLITLNCSYGTVVTAALTRELKSSSDVPMLTLVYDGLKKTNEKTRLEAFMEQVHDRFRRGSTLRT